MAWSQLAESFPQGSPHTPLQKVLNSQISDLSSWQIDRVIKTEGLALKSWFPWHAKMVRLLGPDKYHEIAEMARGGKTPETLFSWLLKQELARVGK